MKRLSSCQCPRCGSEEFISEANRYDCLRFVNGGLRIEKSEFTNAEERIRCRQCGADIDLTATLMQKRIVLSNYTQVD